MKSVLLVLLLVAVVVADEQFDRFLAKFNKHYEGAEYVRRLKIYRSNIRKTEQLNRQNNVFGETKFSDLTQEEFESQYLMPPVAGAYLAQSCLISPDYLPAPTATADEFDWSTNASVVTPVKDQGSCGSCWAFSTTEAVEGQIGVNLDTSIMLTNSLAPKYITDCSKGCTSEIYLRKNTTVCNGGCNGGWPWSAFDDLASVASPTHIAGIPFEVSYPYKPVSVSCLPTTGPTFSITGYTCISQSTSTISADETEMMNELVKNGPLSIALNANYFSYYTGGIFNNPACTGGVLNHAVLIVGYGTDGTTPYWKIKNSWGAAWGEAGYIRMARGKDMCGLAEAVSYPTGIYQDRAN